MVSYDPKIIKAFAKQLYDKASTVAAAYTLFGIVLGGAAGKLALGDTTMYILAAVGGFIGSLIGSHKSFLLKLQAQTALCQVQIEENIRNAASTATREHPQSAADLSAHVTQTDERTPSQDPSRRAAENLAASGHNVAQISKELQRWRGLSASEADSLARSVKGVEQ